MTKSSKKQLLKKAGIIAAFVVMVALLVFGVFESSFHTNVGIKNFNKEFGAVSSSTRRLLRDELSKIAQLNSGKKDYDAGFKIREDGSEKAYQDEQTKDMHGSMYVDSDSLKISLFVQISWNSGFANPDESYTVLVECADSDHWLYESNHCVVPSTSEPLTAFEQENFGILETYDLKVAKLGNYRKAALSYLKSIEPKAKTAFIQAGSVVLEDGKLTAEAEVGFKHKYRLEIEDGPNAALAIYKNNTELWRYDGTVSDETTHHYLTISNHLPVELSTEAGTDFALRWGGNNRIKINSDICKDGDDDEKIIEAAKAWLDSQNFAPDDFSISLINSCTR